MINSQGEEICSYFILDKDLPDVTINRWLEYKGHNSVATSKKYAYSLCRFLNYLDSQGIDYKDATKRDIIRFADLLIFDTNQSIINFNSNRSYNTISSYLSIIKEFYKYLEDIVNGDINIISVKRAKRNRKYTYLYGQIWDMEIKEALSTKLPRTKTAKVNKDAKLYKLEVELEESKEKYKLLLGKLYQIMKKAEANGISLE
jgi:integrase/recombinase XerD